ncbi:MAG: DUF4389 domain-containing protein [Dehalococcoidia bacterium]|nr:MAG: DUF4389 domain-containing protein [Dehalococcoidia bacterium]
MATAESAPYPAIFEAVCPERVSRWKVLLRIFLAIPVLIFWAVVSSAADAVVLGSWLAIIVRRRIPRWLFDFQVALYRWQYRAMSYVLLLTEAYPPFEGDYPIDFDVRYPERLIRWKVLVWKVITSIPHFILLFFLWIGALLATIVAWFYALIAGRYPKGLFDYVVGVIRWSARVNAYVLSLTDEYPPFNLSATAGPAGGDAYLISSIIGFLLTGGIIAGGVVLAVTLPEDLEVEVNYERLQAGVPAMGVEVGDVRVSMLSATDPLAEEETLLEPESGNRLIMFEFSMLNDSWRDVEIKKSDFKLKDEEGDKHDTELVTVDGHAAPEEVEEDELTTVQVVFEVPSEVDPERLDFSPGFAFAKTVKYVFE